MIHDCPGWGDRKKASTAKVVWSNADAEMAILELKDAIERPALMIAPLKSVEKEQAVFTAQFPHPGESGTVAKISEGKLLGLVKIENSSVQAYKTSASMNKANSGGALFDACGNVIGVNMMVKDGAQFAYVVDPLLGGLKAAGVDKAALAKDRETHAAQIDALFRKCFGHKMGPLETADLIGLDTVMRTLDMLYDSLQDPKFRCCPLLRKKVEAGDCGLKSGRGFHDY